jgi:hypothetical protein
MQNLRLKKILLFFVKKTLISTVSLMKLLSIMIMISLISSAKLQSQTPTQEINIEETSKSVLINPNGKTIAERFNPPTLDERVTIKENSFAHYLRSLPLKPHGSLLLDYEGDVLDKQNVYLAVVDMDLDRRDLQQCADAVMRLKGEYLFHHNQKNKITFQLVATGKNLSFTQYSPHDQSYKAFRKYMRHIFSFANTTSLRNQLIPVDFKEMKIGDVFIQKAQNGKRHGHAVIVVDMSISKDGKKRYLLAQSYMPAQETQILINPSDPKISPWYEINDHSEIKTPEWTFLPSDLRRFEDDF